MPFTLTLPDGYGYSVAIALGVIPVMAFGHGIVVGRTRKPAGIPYPNAYASIEQVKTSQAAYRFNAAQRAHGNFLENMSQTMFSMMFAGLFYPLATAGLGVAWCFSRVLFAYGYVYSGKPNGSGRLVGSTFWLCQAGLWALCVAGTLKLF